MNIRLTKELFDDFPVLYQARLEPVTHSLMAFGFQCGDGWYVPIRKLSARLEEWNWQHAGEPVIAFEVKEKYGGLRFYVGGMADEVEEWIVEAEAECEATCEWCGKQEDMGTTQGYISRLCEKCATVEEKLGVWERDGEVAK